MKSIELRILVYENSGLTSTEYSKISNQKTSTIHSQLYKLCKKGLVERFKGPSIRYKNFKAWHYRIPKDLIHNTQMAAYLHYKQVIGSWPESPWSRLLGKRVFPSGLGKITRTL